MFKCSAFASHVRHKCGNKVIIKNTFGLIQIMRKVMSKAEFLATRPTGAKEFIQSRLEGWDCLGCGQCCREEKGRFSIRLMRSEEGFIAFFKGATRRPGVMRAITQDFGDSTLFSFRDGRCMHFDGEEKRCQAYDERPVVCRAFPFVFSLQHDIALSAACPALHDLRDRGILFVYASDFDRPKIPMLARAMPHLQQLLAGFNRAFPQFSVETLFDDVRGEPFYPIR